MIDAIAASPLARAVGYALVQFFWQGAVIGIATALVLAALRRAAPQARYLAAAVGLAALAAAPAITVVGELRQPPAASMGASSDASGTASPALIEEGEAAPVAPPNFFAPVSAERLAPYLPAVLLAWCTGVVIFAAAVARSWRIASAIYRRAVPLTDGSWHARAREIAGHLRLRRVPRLVESGVASMPAVIGWLRPAVIVPASALAGLAPAHLDAILAHELAHVRRGDYLVNVLQCIVETLLFYHPAVWWVSRRMRVEREHCCDDIAAALCGDRVAYAQALTSLEELLARPPGLVVAASGGNLLHRIRRLLVPDRAPGPRWSGGVVMGIVLAVLLGAVGGDTRGMPVTPARVAVSEVLPMAAAAAPPQAPLAIPNQVPTPVPARAARRQEPVPGAAPTAPPQDPGAQSGRALSGRIMDSSGGVVPGVTVILRAGDAVVRRAVTNARGEFLIGLVPAGSYELTASMNGFKTTRRRLEMSGQSDVRVEIRLELGSLVEHVVVTGQRSSPPAAGTRAASWPSTAADYIDAAKMYYTQGRLADAEAMTARALELMRAGAPQVTPVPPPPPPPQQQDPSLPTAPVRVGGDIREPRKIHDVQPVYPPVAITAGVEGTVILEATISANGTVSTARVLRSIPLLDQAAVDAVRQWLFSPTLLNNVAVPVAMTVSVTFQLR